MNLRVLDHPLDSKSLRPLDSAGVYIFLPTTRVQTEEKLKSRKPILAALREDFEVLYVGKAKQLNQRLQNYRRGGSGSAGEWQKSTQLNEEAKSVLLIETPTHFEACLLEVFLIRILIPKLNYTSTGAGRIHFVLQDRESLRLSVSTRKKTGMKVWGIIRARSQARLAFHALAEGLEGFRADTGEISVQPFYSRYGTTTGSNRLIVDIPRKHQDVCRSYLRGKTAGIMSALWNSMKKAADSQQFHLAAQMRDRYLALRELQLQLRRTRKMLRTLRNATIKLPAVGELPARLFDVESFVLIGLRAVSGDSDQFGKIPFVALFNDAIEQFKNDLSGESEVERLRVNFEFLRLMLWWHGKRPEYSPIS